jgi:hypothetical protein
VWVASSSSSSFLCDSCVFLLLLLLLLLFVVVVVPHVHCLVCAGNHAIRMVYPNGTTGTFAGVGPSSVANAS